MKNLSVANARFGHTIYVYQTVDSTQSKAFELARQGAAEGLIVVTQTQTQGRGRESKYWVSDKGGLYFSIIYRPQISLTDSHVLTRMIGACVKRSIERIVAKFMVIELKTKGINDLMLNNRKLVGILVETETVGGDTQSARPNFYIIGIGINVNQSHFPRHYESIATSLRIETSKYFSRFKILRAICEALSVILPN
jgi:BirA family biotin operon repressor/biotin-[acetyl-CoA-carboxylase] ligase